MTTTVQKQVLINARDLLLIQNIGQGVSLPTTRPATRSTGAIRPLPRGALWARFTAAPTK